MSGSVKRPYDSTRRQEQARRTRARIVAAATALFEEQGYGATSIAAIAAEAEVSPQTIYAAFGSKPALLGAAIDVALAGDDEPIPVFERDGSQAAVRAPTPADAAEAFARGATAVLARAGRIVAAADAAAQTDPELMAMCVVGHQARHQDFRRTAQAFAAAGFLRTDVTADGAADLLWVLASPDSYRACTVIRGWTTEQFEAWLVDAVRRSLFDA